MTRENYLHQAGLYSGAFYIFGYAVEWGLKACIAKLFRLTAGFGFPEPVSPKRGGILNLRSHNFDFLVLAASLKLEWDHELNNHTAFHDNCDIVTAWRPEERYATNRTEAETNQFYSAIVDPNHGVMECIKRHW